MKKITRTLITALCFIISINLFSADIYVSTEGNDRNPGTKKEPFASLGAAKEKAKEIRKKENSQKPIKIIIQEGVYYLDEPVLFTADDSGTKQSPLIIEGKGKVSFYGGKALPQFEAVSDNLWKVHIPNKSVYGGSIQQIFINDNRAILAREPNSGLLKLNSGSVEETISEEENTLAIQKIKLTDELFSLLPTTGDNDSIIISLNHAWDQTRKYITQISDSDKSIYIRGKKMQPWNPIDRSSQLFFENSRSFLDSPGEWFMGSDNELYYIPREGETVANTTAIVPVIDNFIIIKGDNNRLVENIHFKNISFKYTKLIMQAPGFEAQQAAASMHASVMVDYAKNIHFDNCEIAHTSNYGVWFRKACTNSSVIHCYIHDLGIGGVKIGDLKIPESDDLLTKHITIDNNIIRSGGYVNPTGVGVFITNASDNTVTHNEIADFRYTGISVGWVWGYSHSPTKRNNISFNHIHHLGWGELSDMGGIYTLGLSEGTVLKNNLIHDIYAYSYGGWGIYPDEGTTGIVIENNLVYKCKSAAFHQHYGKDNIVRNNIFALSINGELEATRIEEHTSFQFTNNIIYTNKEKMFLEPGVAGWANWEGIRTIEDENCFWSTQTSNPLLGNKTLSEWQEITGKDKNSIIADPRFKNPENGNFKIGNKDVIKKISFKPFDYSKSGVYGSGSWKKLAEYDPALEKKFDNLVKSLQTSTE